MERDSTPRLDRTAFQALQAQWDLISQFDSVFHSILEPDVEFVRDTIDRCLEKIAAFEPNVSIIGQVKAGKSTLLNAMVGKPDFLPVDVNPWTSVITGLHFNCRRRPPQTRALFRFFDQYEWDRLIETGGKLGEMANRAGYAQEAEDVRLQVLEMRAATEARLGGAFQRLLGQSHAFAEFDQDMINRYICYGDPDDLGDGGQDGFYADITKSADLYIEDPNFPTNLCFRDTPGVNDTFMMREQTTLNAIGESRACIVVLSAHQALSTMDMALLRIICAIDAREVVIFVNRMDELADPLGEETKIRASITKTLERFGLGTGIEILFGSGYWAQAARSAQPQNMLPAAQKSLRAWADAAGRSITNEADLRRVAYEASGLHQLLSAVAGRIADGPGARMVEELRAEARNIVSMMETVQTIGAKSGADHDVAAIKQRLERIKDTALSRHQQNLEQTREDLEARLRRAQEAFVESALSALSSHVAIYGEAETWTHEPMSLRMSMRSAYLSACKSLDRKAQALLVEGAAAVQDILDVDLAVVGVDLPDDQVFFPIIRPPSSLSATLSLDLSQAWWQRFWKFGAAARLRKKYADVILAETDPLIEQVLTQHFDQRAAEVLEVIQDYLNDRARYITAILDQKTPATKQTRDVA
jgi:hypothetical protein